jgi:hypothetical protein
MYKINPAALRKVWIPEYSSLKDLIFKKFLYYRTKIINKMGEHMKIIEYPGGCFTIKSSCFTTRRKALNILFNRNIIQHVCFCNHMSKLFNSYSSCAVINNKSSIVQPEENINLNPWSLTGFIDGDGSFSILVTKDTSGKLMCKVQPVFTIGLHIKDLPLLLLIKKYFKDAGKIYTRNDG